MGIRFLQSFIERKVEGGVYTVRIDRAIRNANNPLLVIDLMGVYHMINVDKRGALCGGQVTVMEQTASEFFSCLTAAGAELVFFYDGATPSEKYDTWISRQNAKYDNMVEIEEAIRNNISLEAAARRFDRSIPNNTTVMLERVARKHGKLIVPTNVECDQALAAYATNNMALAIISNDTDFLIFPGEWALWSVNHIDRSKLTTRGYNRSTLPKQLRLQWSRLPIWATLAGNDFFQYDQVQPFLHSLGRNFQSYYKLAEYVNSLPPVKNLGKKWPQRILERVYENRPIPDDALKWFNQSISFYLIDSNSFDPNPPMDPMAKFLLDKRLQFVHTVLTGVTFNCTLLFFDYRSTEFGSYYEIIEPIISRIGGIILFHHRHERQHVTVMAKRAHAEPYSRGTVSVTFPDKIAPPHIMELHSPDENFQAALLHRKLQLLVWVCSDDLLDHEQDFLAIPTRYMVTVLVLYRLRRYGVLQPFEADLFLALAYQLSNGEYDPTQEPYPVQLKVRPFRLGFLFQKVYHHFVRVTKALGLPDEYRPAAPYDGLRFHNQYRLRLATSMDPRLMESISQWRLYIQAPKRAHVNIR